MDIKLHKAYLCQSENTLNFVFEHNNSSKLTMSGAGGSACMYGLDPVLLQRLLKRQIMSFSLVLYCVTLFG